MPQSRATAPLNSSRKWSSGFIEMLREVGAQGKTIPSCISWVVYCERFRGLTWAPRSDVPATHVEAPPTAKMHAVACQFPEMARSGVSTSRHYAAAQPNVKEGQAKSEVAFWRSGGLIAPALLAECRESGAGATSPPNSHRDATARMRIAERNLKSRRIGAARAVRRLPAERSDSTAVTSSAEWQRPLTKRDCSSDSLRRHGGGRTRRLANAGRPQQSVAIRSPV